MSKDIYKVYKITNSVNEKVYIGITNDIHARWHRHKKNAINKVNKPLYDSINKYGIDQFTITPICSTFTREDLGKLEQQFIKEQNTIWPNVYNLTSGGEKSWTVSEETRQRLSDIHKGKTLSKEHRQNISNSNKGRKFLKETRQKISEALKGKAKSKEHRQKISELKKGTIPGNKGKYLPDDQVSKHALYMRKYRERHQNKHK